MHMYWTYIGGIEEFCENKKVDHLCIDEIDAIMWVFLWLRGEYFFLFLSKSLVLSEEYFSLTVNNVNVYRI